MSTTPLQAALDAIDQATAGTPERELLASTARGLMHGYHARWHDADWVPVQVEAEYHIAIVNPDTGRISRTFTHAGKMDGTAAFGGRTFLVEHKTCGEDIEDPNSPYWRRLDIDTQLSGYMLAQWQLGNKLDGILYDVIRKPGIRPKAVTREHATEIVNSGTYYGTAVQPERRYGSLAGVKETPDLFEARLAADCTERASWYFQRKTLFRQDNQLLEFSRELWQTSDEIRLARAHDRHYRNSGACLLYGHPCEYLPLCSGHDSEDGSRWTRKTRVHAELPMLEGDGSNVLTMSRLQCFRTCRRKHYYRYELGLERADKEEAESLVFGGLFHEALAAYWRALSVPVEDDHVPGEQLAATEVAG